MDNPNNVTRGAPLPYMDNWRTVLITVAINVALSMALRFGEAEITRADVILHGFMLGLITSVINVFIVRARLGKARELGTMPANVPVSRLMMRLPRNPFLLSLIFGVAFGALAALVGWSLMVFYGFERLPFLQYLVCKVILACVLCSKILEFAIFRLAQSDCAPVAQEEAAA